jgi:hypothetical protein
MVGLIFSVAQTIRQTSGWQMNEMERMWKEVVVVIWGTH